MFYRMLFLLVCLLYILPVVGVFILVLPPLPNRVGRLFIEVPLVLLAAACLLYAREYLFEFMRRRRW